MGGPHFSVIVICSIILIIIHFYFLFLLNVNLCSLFYHFFQCNSETDVDRDETSRETVDVMTTGREVAAEIEVIET